MNIIFICSSLEPGRDGVGDYTRALAGELQRQNHRVAAVALRDHLTNELLTDDQQLADGTLPVLRLPATWPSEKRYAKAKEWIDAFNPDWLSLQFVIYGFDNRGLPFQLSKRLSQLGEGRHWHVMFHELWVGMAREESTRHKLIGWGQKQIVLRLLRSIKPSVIHTQTQLYNQLLTGNGIQSTLLPLFSNIPFEKSGNKTQKRSLDSAIDLVIFGMIHPNVPVQSFAQESALYSKANNVSITLTIVGRGGAQQQYWAECWRQTGLPVYVEGEQSSAAISVILQRSTLGIGTSAFRLIEKSSAVKVMLDHELPVICVAQPFTPYGYEKGEGVVPGIFEYKPGNLADCFNALPPSSRPCSVQSTAQTLIRSFTISK